MTLSARTTLVAASISAAILISAAHRHPIRKPTYDPSVPAVELFDAVDRELVDVSVIARSANNANLFITNRSAEPVSVKLPTVVGAVQVLRQLAPLPQNNLAGNGPAGGNGQGNGQAQPVGGGVQNRGQTNGFWNVRGGNGGPLFSIPSGRTVQLPLKTVCLAYGLPDPHPKLQYRLVRIDEISDSSDLQKALTRYVAGEIDTQTAQAAAWHIKDGMSWKALAEKRVGQIAGFAGDPLFTEEELDDARHLVEAIRAEPSQSSDFETRTISSRTPE